MELLTRLLLISSYLVKCELDHDDNMMVYEIEVKNGNYEYEIDINASNGDILKYEQDYDD